MTEEKVSDDKLKGAIAYLGGWVTGLVLLLIEKKSRYVRFHAMQSLILFGGLSLLSFAVGIIPFIGDIMSILYQLIMLGVFILWVYLMWKAYKGEKYMLPYIGEIAEKQLDKLK